MGIFEQQPELCSLLAIQSSSTSFIPREKIKKWRFPFGGTKTSKLCCDTALIAYFSPYFYAFPAMLLSSICGVQGVNWYL